MNNDRRIGRTTTESPKMLPEWKADANFGQPVPENVGQTVTESAELLPAWEVDGTAFWPVPRIRITVTLRDGPSPAEIAADILKLYGSVNRMELADGGGGLELGIAAGEGRLVEFTLTPVVPDDAARRLNHLAALINAQGAAPERSFENWRASVEQAA